jgi:hypothetical protein
MTTTANLAAQAAKATVIGALLVSVLVESVVVQAQATTDLTPPAATPTAPPSVVSPPPSPPVTEPAAPPATAAPAEPPPSAAPVQPPPALPPPAIETPTIMPTEPPPSEAPMTTKPSKIPSYILWGLGGASLIVGAVFGVSALKAKSDFNDSPSYSRADSAHDRGVAADAALGLGIILAATGTLFYFLEDPAPEASTHANARTKTLSDLRVAPLVTPRAGGGAVSFRF